MAWQRLFLLRRCALCKPKRTLRWRAVMLLADTCVEGSWTAACLAVAQQGLDSRTCLGPRLPLTRTAPKRKGCDLTVRARPVKETLERERRSGLTNKHKQTVREQDCLRTGAAARRPSQTNRVRDPCSRTSSDNNFRARSGRRKARTLLLYTFLGTSSYFVRPVLEAPSNRNFVECRINTNTRTYSHP